MIAVSIISIVASVAMPSFSTFQKNNRIKSVAQVLNSSIRLARSEAIAKNAFVRIELSTQMQVTLCRLDNSADACPAAGDEDIFRTVDISHTGVEVESDDLTLADGFVFSSRGRLVGGGGLAIGVCDDRGASSGTQIQINPVGRSNLVDGAGCS